MRVRITRVRITSLDTHDQGIAGRPRASAGMAPPRTAAVLLMLATIALAAASAARADGHRKQLDEDEPPLGAVGRALKWTQRWATDDHSQTNNQWGWGWGNDNMEGHNDDMDTWGAGRQGPKGDRGPRGWKGERGPRGWKGEEGDTGATGPQGEEGPVGATGPKGATGATGPQGIQGVTGPVGPTGEDGEEGPTGPTGATGPVGATGATGPVGPTGEDGEEGPTGPTGPSGATGPQGVTGPVGPTGEDGEEGPTGPTGATGPIGATGATGPVGPTGEDGEDGETGPTGPRGATGPQGVTGPVGPTGEDGEEGPTGPTGATGPVGATGATGPTGATGATGPGLNIRTFHAHLGDAPPAADPARPKDDPNNPVNQGTFAIINPQLDMNNQKNLFEQSTLRGIVIDGPGYSVSTVTLAGTIKYSIHTNRVDPDDGCYVVHGADEDQHGDAGFANQQKFNNIRRGTFMECTLPNLDDHTETRTIDGQSYPDMHVGYFNYDTLPTYPFTYQKSFEGPTHGAGPNGTPLDDPSFAWPDTAITCPLVASQVVQDGNSDVVGDSDQLHNTVGYMVITADGKRIIHIPNIDGKTTGDDLLQPFDVLFSFDCSWEHLGVTDVPLRRMALETAKALAAK
ncbi:hypothetical protein WJX72_009732 [[Myrmecia] bisecta]|uniref:Uncharacterized protein n=1 Tax=[Myrmecia] bisecta TaxID=41462 RepID=A0AAW1QSD7_9CHLO